MVLYVNVQGLLNAIVMITRSIKFQIASSINYLASLPYKIIKFAQSQQILYIGRLLCWQCHANPDKDAIIKMLPADKIFKTIWIVPKTIMTICFK